MFGLLLETDDAGAQWAPRRCTSSTRTWIEAYGLEERHRTERLLARGRRRQARKDVPAKRSPAEQRKKPTVRRPKSTRWTPTRRTSLTILLLV